jgi:hypothetical protein
MHATVRCLLLALAWAPMLMAAEPGGSDPAAPVEAAADAGPDRLELDSTSIRGNQELPRVLYIVPWKDPALGDLAGRPANSLVEEALAPVDREVFLRQTRYFDQLYGADSADGP